MRWITKGRFFGWLGTVLILFLLLLWFFPRKSDREDYLALLQLSEGKKEEKTFSPKQFRQGVVKEIWLHGNYLRLEAPTSELFLIGGKEAIEELHDLHAMAREELSDKCLVREMTSEVARFHYRNLMLSGKAVHFSSYALPLGLIKANLSDFSPEMSGIAEETTLQLKEEKIDFHARKIKVALEPHL